jgi:hypothetical protein
MRRRADSGQLIDDLLLLRDESMDEGGGNAHGVVKNTS